MNNQLLEQMAALAAFLEQQQLRLCKCQKISDNGLWEMFVEYTKFSLQDALSAAMLYVGGIGAAPCTVQPRTCHDPPRCVFRGGAAGHEQRHVAINLARPDRVTFGTDLVTVTLHTECNQSAAAAPMLLTLMDKAFADCATAFVVAHFTDALCHSTVLDEYDLDDVLDIFGVNGFCSMDDDGLHISFGQGDEMTIDLSRSQCGVRTVSAPDARRKMACVASAALRANAARFANDAQIADIIDEHAQKTHNDIRALNDAHERYAARVRNVLMERRHLIERHTTRLPTVDTTDAELDEYTAFFVNAAHGISYRTDAFYFTETDTEETD